MTSGELARAAFTSKATVVRLSQKLGLTGYQEFRLKLVEEMNQKNRLAQMLESEPIHGKSSYTDIIKNPTICPETDNSAPGDTYSRWAS